MSPIHGQPADHRSTLDQVGRVVAYGQSIIAGNVASDTTRDLMTRLASMLNAKEMNWAKGGAMMMWENDPTRNEFGVYATVLQTLKRPIRAATTIATVDPAVGATVLTTAHNPLTTSATGVPFKLDDVIHVGTGTNGELCRVTGLSSTQITLSNFEGGFESYGGLLRDHAIGEPVYMVPTHYGADNTIFLLCSPGQGVFYNPGVYANAQRWYQEPLRAVLSRLRAAEIYEPDHSAVVFSGSWGASVFSTSTSGSYAAQGARNATAVSAAVTFHVPDNFPGGAVSFNFLQTAGGAGGGVWTFTVDGAGAATLTTVATPTTPVNKQVYYCKRFTGLAAGRHTIVATMTTFEANCFVDYFGIEAEDPPGVLLFKAHRLPALDVTGTAESGFIRPTLQAQANPGATSITVNQQPIAGARNVINSPQVPKAGEYLVINPRTSLEEVRTVTTVTGATAPFTINFSGGGLANTHPVGTRTELGISDYVNRQIENPWVEQIKAEFDDSVLIHDPETYAWPQAAGTYLGSGGPKVDTAGLFHKDSTHFSDRGQAVATENIYQQLVQERRIAPRSSSRLSRPLSIPTTRVSFLDWGMSLLWSDMPAALSEFPLTNTNNGGFRRVLDMSRYYEARIGVIQTMLAASNAKLRIQYSIDQGTSFRYLHRLRSSTDAQLTSTNWAESTSATDTMCQVDLVTAMPAAGVKYTSWEPIYPEALMPQYIDVLLRVVGIGNDGTTDPAFLSIWVELR